MKKKINEKVLDILTTEQLEKEYEIEKNKFRRRKLLRSTIYVLVVVFAISVLVANLMFPVLRIYGKSMNPTLKEKDVVLCVKKSYFEQGDIIAFYYNNRILVKRVIATSSDWVDIDNDGNVFVNDKLLIESYVEEKYYGEVDTKFPYQVPADSYFVLGDKRDVSIDSRNSLIGSILEENIIGKVVFRVWPLKKIEIIR